MGKYPSKSATPIMRYKRWLGESEGLNQRTDVVGKREDIIAVRGALRAGIASKIGCVNPVFAESFHDPPPAHPPFGEAMQKENGRSLPGPCCCHMEANAVGSDL